MDRSLFNFVAEDRLYEILDNLSKFTSLPIVLIDPRGETLMRMGKTTAYCRLIQKKVYGENRCPEMHMKAGETSYNLGEAYVFTCHGELNHIAFPLTDGNSLLGSVIVGPFIMDKPDSTLVSGYAEKTGISPSLSLELYDALDGIPIIEPARVNYLKKLLDQLLSALLPGEKAAMLQKQEKLYQQSRINETIQTFKGIGSATDLRFLYEKEKLLLTRVKSGNVAEAKGLLNELIGHALFSEGGSIEAIKPRAVELSTLLSRVAMDGGAEPERLFELNSKYISMLYNEQDIEELCLILQDMVESFMSSAFYVNDKGNPYIRKALGYIADNYSVHLTLKMAADHVGLSPSYFSGLFNETVGISFSEQLNRVRVEESKRLLESTKYELADIAAAMGFPDQSYYCKVFKRITGVSPGRFRGGSQTVTRKD